MVPDTLKHEESEKKVPELYLEAVDLKCQNDVENCGFPDFVQKCLELSFLIYFIEFRSKNNVGIFQKTP